MRAQFKRLSKGTVIYGLGGILNRFIGLLMLPLFTSYLTPADYGVSSILGLVSFIMTSVFTLGFGVSIGVSYYEGDNPQRKTAAIWTASFFLLLSVLLMLGLGIGFAQPISRLAFQLDGYSKFITPTTIGAAFTILTTPFILRLQFEERAKLFVLLTAVSTVISISINIIFVVALKWGVWGVVLGGMIGQIISFLFYFAAAARKLPVKIELAVAKELLRLGLPMVPSFTFVFVIQQGNKYILQMLRGLEESGLYTVGFNLGLALNYIVSAFQTAWYPFFMSFFEKREEARALFGRVATYYCIGFGTLNLMFYLAARPVVMILTRAAFHEAYQVVGLSATSSFFFGLFSLILPGMYFAKEVKFVALIQGASALISVGVNLLLIPRLGFVGAALGLAIGSFSMVVFTFLFSRLRNYLNVAYEWPRLFSFSVIYLTLAAVSFVRPSDALPFVILQSALLTLMLIGAIFFLLTKEEKLFIKEIKETYLNWNTLRTLIGSTRNVFNNL
ncbi:MAG: oligosaccharide flippase family protein [Anaerolineaceae bacterium]|nr:oligosaccharide flippase family protein [Anaerolineaceae bacterium]